MKALRPAIWPEVPIMGDGEYILPIIWLHPPNTFKILEMEKYRLTYANKLVI